MVNMAVVKRSISFDAQLWEQVTAELSPGEVSAVVNKALDDLLRRRRGLAAVAEWEAENGALSAEELAEADAILDAAGIPNLTGE